MSISNSGISSSCKSSKTQKLEIKVDIPLLLYCPHFISVCYRHSCFMWASCHSLAHTAVRLSTRLSRVIQRGKESKDAIQDVMQHGRGFRNEILARFKELTLYFLLVVSPLS